MFIEFVILVMYVVYKVLVCIFVVFIIMLLDGYELELNNEDCELFVLVGVFLGRNFWVECGLISMKDFLLFFGSGEIEGNVYYGFLK